VRALKHVNRQAWCPAALACGLASLLLCAPAQAVDRVIADGGASRYEIVCDKAAGKVARLAAKELQSFLQQATGACLPIVAEPSPDRGRLFVGDNPHSAAAGVRSQGLRPEGFRLTTVGQDVHIIGVDQLRGSADPAVVGPGQVGTLTGVYEFLERSAGVMFLWHDDLGTIVPKHEKLVVPDLDVNSAPDWSYRSLPYSPEGATGRLFGRRLRLGQQLGMSHSHAWHRILPAEKYGAEHPEYFAEIGGRRRAVYYSEHHGGQVCTSNPQVVERFAQAAIDCFNRFPDRDMFSVSPNDGGGFCECTRCRALDQEPLEDDPAKPALTDRLLTFYNVIAQRLAKVHPHKLLGAYIYSYYRQPARRVKPHPNLALVHATNSAWQQGSGWPRERQWERQWLSLTQRVYKYDIYYRGSQSLHLMAPVTTHIAEKISAEHEVGIQGGYLYIGQSYEQLGAGHYLLARLMWDRHADVRQLERRCYDALYGPAGADVLAYYHLLEERLRRVHLQGVDVREPALEAARRSASAGGDNARYILAAYWPILDEASRLIERAQGRALSDLSRQRLARLVDHHELMLTTVRGMVAAGRIEAQATATADDAAKLVAAVDQRQRIIERLRAYAPTLVEYLEQARQGELSRLAPDGPFYRLAAAWKSRGDAARGQATPCGEGTFENVSAGDAEKRLRLSAEGGATIGVTDERAYAGRRAVHVKVPAGGHAAFSLSAPVAAGHGYRLVFAYRNQPSDAEFGPRDLCPRVRIICRNPAGKATTPTKAYTWGGVPPAATAGKWALAPQMFGAPPATTTVSVTFFFQWPGEYWLDDVRLEDLGGAPGARKE
jgi:hypothetical protein